MFTLTKPIAPLASESNADSATQRTLALVILCEG